MSDIVERLNQYNPPDRTIDEQRQMSVDIHERESPTHMGEPVLPKHGIGGGGK